MRIPDPRDPRMTARMWVPEQDRARWRDIVGPLDPEPGQAGDGELTFREEELDTRCRYGENTHVFDDTRTRRVSAAPAASHSWGEAPRRLGRVPRQEQRLALTAVQRRAMARQIGCRLWEVGPCAGCGALIKRYGSAAAHACARCRAKVRTT